MFVPKRAPVSLASWLAHVSAAALRYGVSMPQGRPAIPRALDRQVRVEAGHRCAIPTCRATAGLQIHHITPYARVKEHTFENLILVCSNCHSRITSGEIDRPATLAYKTNLGILIGRYGDLERRVLQHFIKDSSAETVVIDKSLHLLIENLILDGLLEFAGTAEGALWLRATDDEVGEPPLESPSLHGPMSWRLTEEGRALLSQLRRAETIQ